jgi:protein SCO1
MKKYRPFITLFLILILPLLVYGFMKLVSEQHYKPIETISEKIPNPDGSPDSVFRSVGDFAFSSQTGATITQDSLVGKIWVCNLFFGNCTESCDRIHSEISKLQSDTRDHADVRFVSISVDPTHDSVAVLKQVANRLEATPHRWYLLTGNPEQIRKFLHEELNYEDIAPEDIAAGLLRESTLRLIDWEGRFRGEIYDGLDHDAVVRLSIHLDFLEKEYADRKAGKPIAE